ncbi:agmatine deiminase family protein [uncultured Helicobacter sp.]|uniref:agmatine deiminase family protein n=1 Tax=uncultured Helicobacter sp. TaxID=175537 RepID=UPI002635449E|nr:agmatine deiminase family protein [uncultured Helicobacter sp.]
MDRVRLKAEWEEQVAILMAFPHINSDWALHIDRARECFIRIIEHILCFESVILCIDVRDNEGIELLCDYFKPSSNVKNTESSAISAYIRTHIRDDVPQVSITNPFLPHFMLDSHFTLHIVRIHSNDTWARDFGGIGIEKAGNGEMLKFMFNGWGLKYPANYDNRIVRDIFTPQYMTQADMVLEGGSIESNGAGVLLTNTQCLLEPNRNPHLAQSDIESKLKAYFGLKQVLWLHNGYLEGDDTDSHIDTLARFITPDTIAYIACADREDSHFEALKCMETELKALKQPNGEPYKLIALPFTQAIYDEHKQRLPSSYANFLFVNNALLVPTYDDKNDSKALAILSRALPHYKVVGVPCSSLILWHGSLHCVTMQLYAD